MFPTLLTADAGRMQFSVNYPTTTCVLNTAKCLIDLFIFHSQIFSKLEIYFLPPKSSPAVALTNQIKLAPDNTRCFLKFYQERNKKIFSRVGISFISNVSNLLERADLEHNNKQSRPDEKNKLVLSCAKLSAALATHQLWLPTNLVR